MNQQIGELGELPTGVGPSQEQQNEIAQRWNTYTEIEYRLMSSNIHPLNIPAMTMPEINSQILQGLNDQQYMETYAAFDAWNSYIGETVGQLNNIILQIKNEMDDLRIHVVENMINQAKMGKEKRPPAAELDFAVDSNPRSRWLKLELQKNQQHLNRLESRQKTLSRAERLLSRNIELIKSGRESGTGGSGIQRRGSQMPARY